MKTSAAQLWIVLAKCHRAVLQHAENSIASTGLCFSDFTALEALLHKGPMTISEIGTKVLLTSGSMTAAIDRLENRGLVVRESVEADRRSRMIRLTKDGQELIAPLFRKHSEDLEKLMSVLDERERQQIYGPLKKLGLAAAAQPPDTSGTEK